MTDTSANIAAIILGFFAVLFLVGVFAAVAAEPALCQAHDTRPDCAAYVELIRG